MSSPDLLARLDLARRLVTEQAATLHAGFGRVQSQWKTDGSRVTPTDLAISHAILDRLASAFPEDETFSEELTATPAPLPLTARFAWILDPIDGTNNFATGIPYCAISLALLEHGVPVAGVIYDAARRVLFHGGPGLGAFEGDRPLQVRATPPRSGGMLGFHSPSDKTYAPHAALLVQHFKIRGLGSSTLHLAYVAAGLLDGTVDHNVKVWDIAAAVPLCQAAGGEVHYFGPPLFPLRTFDLNMPRVPFYAGPPTLCHHLAQLLDL